MFFCQVVVDGVDLGDDEPDANEEAEAGTKIDEADLCSREPVIAVAAVDGFEIGVQAIRGSEKDGLPDGHGQNDGLSEEDSQGPLH